MSDLFERVLLLKKSQIFSEVSTEDLRVVAQALEEEAYFEGDRVFDINDQGDHMYLLLSGKVGISLNEDPAVMDFVAELGPGECFGEMGMLDDLPRSATAHVLENARMLTLEKARLRGLITSYPELALGMLRGITLRLRSANARLNQQG
jgi:CRP/FNR family cyclic AMP-dependent transcriptional regulator